MPNPKSEYAELYEEQKKIAYADAGLVFAGRNSEGESEWIGTSEKWKEAEENLEESINNLTSKYA